MDLDIDPEDKHMLMMEKMMYILGKRMDRLMANLNAGNPEQHIPFPKQTQTLRRQDMYDQQDYKENKQEIMMEKMMHMLGKRTDRLMANTNRNDLEQATFSLDQTQAQSPRDQDCDQDMYYDQYFIKDDEQTYEESNEEGFQQSLNFLPMSCTMLIRDLHD